MSLPGPIPADADQADAVTAVVPDVMASEYLKAVIVRVTIDGADVITRAYGESMPGCAGHDGDALPQPRPSRSPTCPRCCSNSSMSRRQPLEDEVSQWLPQIPHADEVTLRQLAQMTSGIVDYVTAPELSEELYADPFRSFTPEQLIAIGTSRPLLYEPGTNWNYAHTNYVILGLALEKITGKGMTDLLQEKVLGLLGLTNTTDPGTPDIPDPVLHAYSSERRYALGIPATTPFYEDSTYWNPSWTITHGAIQTTNIYDLNTTAVAIGTGKLLSSGSYQKMITKDLIGKTTTVPGCLTCLPQQAAYTYGLGIISSGDWLVQNPLFVGEAGAFAYLPARKVAIAVAVTFMPEAFTSPSSPKNSADYLWRRIAAVLVPADAPPIPPDQQ